MTSRSASTYAALETPLVACASGQLPPNVALMQMLAAAPAREDAEAVLTRFAAEAAQAGGNGAERLRRLLALWHATPTAWDTVKRAVGHVEHNRPASCSEWAATFDRAAESSADATAALYALGRADVLRAATLEIVNRLRTWRLLHPQARVLDLGCGSGRMLAALAPLVGSITGTDISERMLMAARDRCGVLGNVHIVRTDGHGLAGFDTEIFDLVLCIDVFPYFNVSRGDLVRRHFAETCRVLSPGGALLILNYAYGSDFEDESLEVACHARSHGLEVVRAAGGDFALWDGRTFHLRRER
jgi:ubiquinone/menaquinone biosynthesis C-methylase UbiE